MGESVLVLAFLGQCVYTGLHSSDGRMNTSRVENYRNISRKTLYLMNTLHNNHIITKRD